MDLDGSITLIVLALAVSAAIFASLRDAAAAPRRSLTLTLVGTALGAFAGSEWFGILSDWGPTYDGLNFIPAVIGAVVVGALAGLSTVAPAAEPPGREEASR